MPARDPFAELTKAILDAALKAAHSKITGFAEELLAEQGAREYAPPPRAEKKTKSPKPPKLKRRAIRTHYDTLEVRRTAPLFVIEAAYKALSKKHHPDVGGNAERMKDITAAYAVLKDPEKRKQYDRSLR